LRPSLFVACMDSYFDINGSQSRKRGVAQQSAFKPGNTRATVHGKHARAERLVWQSVLTIDQLHLPRTPRLKR